MTLATEQLTTTSLLGILRMARPPKSDAQITMRDYIKSFAEKYTEEVFVDGYGNLFADVGDSSTMFTAHIDTVDRQPGQKVLALDTKTNIVHVKEGECLGADDGTGIWLMLNMIQAGVSGLYCFFLDEEIGGRGSSYAAQNGLFKWSEFNRCISFDRKGYGDVITHQACGRSCSDDFARALAKQLNKSGLSYKPDDTGSFTDSANFTELVAECTNLSVGYFSQHGPNETQDLQFAADLAKALVEVDWEALPIHREPGEDDLFDDRWDFSPFGLGSQLSPISDYLDMYEMVKDDPAWAAGQLLGSEVALADLVEAEPDIAATMILNAGYTAEDIGLIADGDSDYNVIADFAAFDPGAIAMVMKHLGITLKEYMAAREEFY